jgi:DNA-binding XRE family transcriptional regulator
MSRILFTNSECCQEPVSGIDFSASGVSNSQMVKNWDGPGLDAIGRRLAVTRQVLGLQQNEFCERAKIAPNTYNQYEKGKKRPSVPNAIKLCDAYQLTLDWIFRGDPSGLRYETADAIKAARAARAQ